MKRKKLFIFLCVAILLLQTTGCNNSKTNSVAMGRYLEEQISFPGANLNNILITGLQRNVDNKIELYEISKSSKRYTRRDDGTWKEEPLDWLNKLVESRNSISDALIVHGLDGNDYAMLAGTDGEGEEDSKARLYRHKATGSVEEIQIKEFENYEVNGNWKDYSIPKEMYVFEDGSILLGYMAAAILYNGDGEILIDYNTESGCNLAASNDKVYILNLDRSQVLVYDKSSGEQLNSIEVVNNGYTSANRSLIHLFTGREGELYLQNKEGIHKLSEGGSLWEIIVDGKLNSIASPSINWEMACQADDGSFYLVSLDNAYSLYHYSYHPEVSTEPSIELSVYSLQEYKTIREAALLFQNTHADVKVNYYAAITNDDSEDEAELIQAFNTEILAKKAADVIILDGLDIDSYMEKGVLDNISDVIDPMIASKELYEKIAQTYRRNGAILAVPISMEVPVILGSASAVRSSASLEKLTNYVKEQSKRSVFGDIDRSYLIQLLYDRYLSEQIAGHKISREELTSFFEMAGSITEKTVSFSKYGEADCAGELGVLRDVSELNISNLYNSVDFGLIMQIASEVNAACQVFQHQYEPGITVGVNSSGKQKELAKEFIKLLLTDKIQNNWFYEGIPVRRDCVSRNLRSSDDSSNVIMYYGYSYQKEFVMYQVDAPSEKDIKSYEAMLEQLETPVFSDKHMKDKAVELTEQYLEGSLTAAAATEAFLNFMSLYYEE